MADQRHSSSTNSSCSGEDEKIITSSSPSSSTPRSKHGVFLSFHGKDTRMSFTDHLYIDLKRKGILVFRDNERLKRGKCISQELWQAIQESQYAIVIFSANYASSKWCLMELAEIVEWKKKMNLTIIPIFYHVDPSDVRNQRGTFAEAFTAHEKDPEVDIKEIDTWRDACREVGKIAGEHVHEDRYESTIIQKISGIIFYNYTRLNILIHDYQKLVGINSSVEEMMKKLHMESNDVRFLGIHGMGGVGKTTLAEIIYYRVSCQFEGSIFISCIREESRTRGLASLQKQLLSMIMQEELHIWDHHQGIMVIRTRLQNKKVLIVLDDVDSEKQLMALAANWKWFGPGSRVIITCRDSHLLITHGVNDVYKVELLQTTDALRLFSLSAFKQTHPLENYNELSMDFVNYAQGLPLALKVLGSFLLGRTIDAWKSARDQLEATPNKELMNILQISFDGLEESQQKLFLDVACFSQGRWPLDDNLTEIYPNIDIEVLVDKSLVSKSKYAGLIMHDLLKRMGWEIVRRECREEPGRRSRLFRAEDVCDVLKNDAGTDAIEGIDLDFFDHEAKHSFNINAKAFSKMRKLRFLQFGHLGFTKWCGNPLKYMPSDMLRVLHWLECPSKSWPSSFQPKNLTILSMPSSRFKRLWKGLMVLDNLKYLYLSGSWNLIETPDLSGAPKLEIIDFSYCTSLCKVHPSIKLLKGLQKLKMSGTRIKKLWKGLAVLNNLKYLNLRNSKNLIEIPDLTGTPNLEEIYIKGCISLCELHPSIKVLKRLKRLSLNHCECLTRLVNFPDIQGDMTSLKSFYFSKPPNLLSSFMSFPGLRDLELRDCKNISIFPSVICSLSSLEILRLYGWPRLEKFPDLSSLECLTRLEAYGTAITQVPSVNLIPRSIRSFKLEGRKRMPHKSRDFPIFINDCSLPKQSSYPTNHDIGSHIEYEMEEMLEVEALQINFGSVGKYTSDIIFADTVMINGWSLGSRIPEWVQNTSNGSSVKIELDGIMKGMDCAIFIVCDYHQFHSPEGTSISSLFKERTYVKFKFCFETDDGSLEDCFYQLNWFPPFTDICFVRPIVFWAYTRTPRFFKRWKSNNLDKQSFIKISVTAEIISFLHQIPLMELEVKECGMHLKCPDDADLGLGSDLDSYRQFYSAWKCGMTRNDD
ncbi:disease resistance protein RPV1-like isoform X1 [Carya illinoinensis]|uniref:disease resistance protein RPV1-like isoform X1 n=1 Tax=Carya illinoinensis TaxID=32201 RepID=UPI001C720FDD|nr:disease resistance protein RPV1-like isoform X1 [Carya illinoinensis]